MSGYYLYGFVPADTPAPELTGLNDNPVEIVVRHGVGVVTEPVDPAAFQRALQQHLDDPPWLAERALHHEHVVGQFLDVGICPLRFATLIPDWQGLEPLLSRQAEHVRSALDQLRGLREWTLRVWIERDAHQSAVLADPELRAEQQALEGATGGKAYLLKRKFEQGLERARKRALLELHDHLRDDLAARCDDHRHPDRRPDDDPEHLGVLELVCLLGDAREQSLRDHLATLAADHGLVSDLSGPFAPYHFVDLDLSGTA